jgi:hypothetical protein
MEDKNHLYREEFYVLWCAGIKDDPITETVIVCSATLYGGQTTIIRNFLSLEGDDWRADEKFLAWISHDPYVAESSTLDIEIISNVSPLFAFSTALSDLITIFKQQQKSVNVELKMVRLINVEDEEEDSDDNKDGLRILHSSGIRLSPVSGKDWGYLRQILREKRGLVYQDDNYLRVRKRLAKIIKHPQDAQTSLDVELENVEFQKLQLLK